MQRHSLSEQHQSHAGLSGGAVGQARSYQHQALYQQLLPVVRHVLEVLLANEFEESTVAVTNFVLNFRFSDGSDTSRYMPPRHSELVMKGRVMEALAHWIKGKTLELDCMIPLVQSGLPFVERPANRTLEEGLPEFVNAIFIDLLGAEAACLGNAVGGMMAQTASVPLLDYPSMFLAHIVRKLEEIQARVSKIVMELYELTEFMSFDDSKNDLMMFFQHYTVETTSGTLEVHETGEDDVLRDSPFRVNLIDSFGSLMSLLAHLEEMCSPQMGSMEAALAVDFEGVKLCRHGALCLVQLTCSDDPRLVYVLDVHMLGKRAFTMETPRGTSMKVLLEEQSIRKVWFDPRNDVDALYHQFGITPHGVFDLQLAEVADRRNRGLKVNYVQGLYKCLTQCPMLQAEQKVFAEKINKLGKQLFEPQNGGSYEIFQQRPLNPVILVYAAHDSRYMLALYDQYLQSIGSHWVPRVLRAGDQRAQWCLQREYVVPATEAPDF